MADGAVVVRPLLQRSVTSASGAAVGGSLCILSVIRKTHKGNERSAGLSRPEAEGVTEREMTW